MTPEERDERALVSSLRRLDAFEAVSDECKAEVVKIALNRRGKDRRKLPVRTQLHALELILDRTDPAPKTPAIAVTGPVLVTWTPPSTPSSLPNPTSTRSIAASVDSASASATGDSGKPSWL